MSNIVSKCINKYKNMSAVAKSSYALIFAKFFQKGIAFLTGPIFTRIMPKAEYGIVSTFFSWEDVIYIIATLNLAQGVFNNGMLDYKEDRDGFTCSILALANTCTVALAIIYLAGYKWLSEFIGMPDVLMVLLFAYCLFMPAYNYWMSRQRFEYKYKAITLIMIISTVLSSIFAIGLVLLVPDEKKAVAKLYGSQGTMILIGLVFFIYTWGKVRTKFKMAYCIYAIKYNLPLIPHYLSMYVLASSDKIMITKICGEDKTAVYTVAYTVATILLILWNSVDATYAPWIYQKMENKEYQAIGKRAQQILSVFLVGAIVATLFAPEIMMFLAPASYQEGVYIIPAVSAGVFFIAVYSLYMRIELYLKKMHTVTIGTVTAAIANLALNALFIPKFGYYAAAYTTLFCYALLSVFHFLNVKRLGYAHIYKNRFVLGISVLMILLIMAVSLVYRYPIIRYICIVVIVTMLILLRKKIVCILKNK